MLVTVVSKRSGLTRAIDVPTSESHMRMRTKYLREQRESLASRAARPIPRESPRTTDEKRRLSRREQTCQRELERVFGSLLRERINLARNRRLQDLEAKRRERRKKGPPPRSFTKDRSDYRIGLEHAKPGREYTAQKPLYNVVAITQHRYKVEKREWKVANDNIFVRDMDLILGGKFDMSKLKWDRFVPRQDTGRDTWAERLERQRDLKRWKRGRKSKTRRSATTSSQKKREGNTSRKSWQKYLSSGAQYRMTYSQYKMTKASPPRQSRKKNRSAPAPQRVAARQPREMTPNTAMMGITGLKRRAA